MKPNIVFITSDQQRRDSLGIYGCRYVSTPNLDRLGSQATVYEHCYCNAPVCTPSRACMMTGKTMPGHGVYNLFDILPENEKMLPYYLREQGYETALVGKLHVSGTEYEVNKRNPGDGFDIYDLAHEPSVYTKAPYNAYARWLLENYPDEWRAIRAQGRKPALRIKMPDEDIAFDDLIRGTIEFKAGSVPDYVIVRPNGDPLYTLTNPVDDAMMEVNVVLRGEDLLSSTPRQIVLYRYLMELGIAKEMPLFGHMPYVMGQGNKKLSKRDPESNLFNHRDNGFIREGLLNYLALLGWSIAPDRDVFSMDEMTEKFDVRDVKANPARFDIDKAISINAEHIRMLEPEDFLRRSVPYLHRDGVVSADNWDALTDREREVLTAAAPLVQPRVRLLGEVAGMVGSLLSTEGYLEPADDAKKQLKDSAGEVLDKAIAALEAVDEADWKTDNLHETLNKALVEEGGYKPRLAFGPVRVAMSGRRVSPPLFESMEIVGKPVSLARLKGLREHL